MEFILIIEENKDLSNVYYQYNYISLDCYPLSMLKKYRSEVNIATDANMIYIAIDKYFECIILNGARRFPIFAKSTASKCPFRIQ